MSPNYVPVESRHGPSGGQFMDLYALVLNFIQHISTKEETKQNFFIKKKLSSSTSLLVTVMKESFFQNYNVL